MTEIPSKTFTRLRNILKAGLLNFVFQIIFLILLYFTGYQVSLEFSPAIRAFLLTAIVLIPSILWTLFFYLWDRREPEPLSYILISFLAGMSAASLGVIPIYRVLFRLHEWIYESFSLFLVGSFLVSAPIVCLLLYAVIRYGFYPSKEFDEPVDGMVYGAFSGCGVAFILSMIDLWLNSDFTIFVIGYTATTHVLVYSGIGAVIGFMIGRAKFQQKSIDRTSIIGVLIGIILLGIYHLINEFIFIRGFPHAFWLSFFLSLIYAFLILLFCTRTMQRLTSKDLHKNIPVKLKWDRGVVILAIVLLTTGGIIAHIGLKGKEFRDPQLGIAFHYPHSLSRFPSPDTPQSLLLPQSASVIFAGKNGHSPQFSFSVMVYPANDMTTNSDWMNYMDVSTPESFKTEEIQIGNAKGHRLAYSYLETATESDQLFPVYKQVYKDIFPKKGEIYVFTFQTTSENFEAGLMLYQKILASVKWLQHQGGASDEM